MDFPAPFLIRALAAIAFAWAGAAAAAQPGAPLPPVAQFFQPAGLQSPSLSPDGRQLAFIQHPRGGRARLAVLDLKTLAPAVVASFVDDDISSFRWVNDHRLVFQLKTVLTGPGTVKAAAGLFAVNSDGSGFRQLVETVRYRVKNGNADLQLLPWNTYLNEIVGEQDSDDVFVITPEEIHLKKVDYIALRRLNTVTGRTSDVEAPLHSFGWVADRHGQLRAAITRSGKATAIEYRDDAGKWSKLDEFDTFVGAGLTPRYIDPAGQLYVRAASGDKAALFTYDPVARKLGARPVLASPEFDIDVHFIANRDKLLGLRYLVDAQVTTWLDPGMQAVQEQVDALLPGSANLISVPARAQANFVLVDSFSDVQPNVYYLYQTHTRKLMKVGSILPAFDPAQLGRMDFVHYKARDGMTIPAYLTMPPGAVRKQLPMVVLVHGGPWVRGGAWRWDPEVQFLASRGYVVLQPEFRGSAGFGTRHLRAGWKQWGLAMQDDLADGARWAIAEGIADPARICIAGASYGGYAALMGLARDPGLFRCGVEWVGVTDINLMYDVGWSDFSDDYKRFGMPTLVGDQVADAAQLKATSPIEQAARITQPLLLAYGGYDVRVPIVHGEKFRDAIKAHNGQVEWIEYDEEGHGWQKPDTNVDFWTRVERFLARQLTPSAAP
jgi:dipeptidyl aminopeptidase/acylaminoacyl peptidase